MAANGQDLLAVDTRPGPHQASLRPVSSDTSSGACPSLLYKSRMFCDTDLRALVIHICRVR